MKTKILTLLVSLIFAGSAFAQSHSISYTFSVEGCGEISNLQLFSGIMFEGDFIEFGEYTLPKGNTEAQFFYNFIVGGQLGFPQNSLKENIHVDIKLAGLCDIDLANLKSENDLLKLLYLKILVTGENSGSFSANQYYYLENNKEAFLKLPLNKINPFLNYLSYSIDDFTPFYVDQQEQADFVGIRKAVENDYLSIYSKHFSTIGVGFKVVVPTPTDVNSLETTPNEYGLAQNYPNPFNPSTTISYTLPNSGFTKLSVYNSLGQEVQSLINDNQSAGTHTVNFNASNLPSGMYFYSLTSGNFTQTNKMILMK